MIAERKQAQLGCDLAVRQQPIVIPGAAFLGGRPEPPADLSAEVSRAKAAKPDIIAPITRPASAQLLLPEIRKQRLDILGVVGPRRMAYSEVISLAGGLPDTSTFPPGTFAEAMAATDVTRVVRRAPTVHAASSPPPGARRPSCRQRGRRP